MSLVILIILTIEVVLLRNEVRREKFMRQEMIGNVTGGVSTNNARVADIYTEIVQLRVQHFDLKNDLQEFWREIGWSAAIDRGRYQIRFLPVMMPRDKNGKPKDSSAE